MGRIAVETSIMASVPGGEPQRMLLVGGKEFGNFTLLRLYSFHVFVLPLLFAGLLLLHRRQVVRHARSLRRFLLQKHSVKPCAFSRISCCSMCWR